MDICLMSRTCFPFLRITLPSAVLNLSQGASPTEINERYRYLSLAFHPDKQTDLTLKEAAMKEFLDIQKAYQG